MGLHPNTSHVIGSETEGKYMVWIRSSVDPGSISYTDMKFVPLLNIFTSAQPPWSDTPPPVLEEGHRTVTSMVRVPWMF
jgi:hypothetical protein